MSKQSFLDLCNILIEKHLLHDTPHISVSESLALFLYILAHNKRFRDVGGTYLRSTDTICRHFSLMLRAILKLTKEYIKLPEARQEQRWRWFENCIGALDGTHIEVTVPVKDQGRYRNRKQAITTNVLGVCDRNMKFVYVLPGWEGSSSDSRVLRSALERSDRFEVPTGKYYLVDARYTNGQGYLASYRSTRYHLKEWSAQGNNPTNYKELFNLRHSTERNVIERTFGLLKKRWAILRQPSFFNIKIQVQIINVCFILHNFLVERRLANDFGLLEEVDAELSTQVVGGDSFEYDNIRGPVQAKTEWSNFRDTLAINMFNDYQARRD
ncbi:hypothetical protein KSP39_PZI015955 [Platanthera zijinensis]|uniref:Transposase n=1 Tax=Platanthera zijinensis TaxID=2320716 RepID=A0AAP0B9E4_9ASPA